MSTLAHISIGYSAGSIKETCEKVLTEYRIRNQDYRPLTLNEFIGPLSLRQNTMDDQYEEIKAFTDGITGDKKRRDTDAKALLGDDDGKDKKKKKASDPSNPVRIKKAMTKWRAKFMDDKTRITIIGCTSEPENGSAKEFKKFFNKAIYFPFPDYSTRRLMWKTFIEKFRGRVR